METATGTVCDASAAEAAAVRFRNPGTGGVFDFCGHHAKVLMDGLAEQGYTEVLPMAAVQHQAAQEARFALPKR